MRKFIRQNIKGLGLIAILGTLIVINAFSAPAAQAQDSASEIFQLVNNFRASLGLPAFRWNSQLAAASQTQANWMIANPRSFIHTWPDGTTKEMRARAAGYNGRVVENIVGGWDMTPQRALNWWQNSPPHYNTITSSFYVEAGTAYAGSGRQGRYVIVVGNRGAAAAARPVEPETEVIIVDPVVIAEPGADGQIVHVAGQGHALWTLAAYYEVEVTDLLLYNDMDETDFVSVGDEIIIKPADGWLPPPTPTPPYSVFVGNGQTLWTIAAIHKVELADILLFNGLGPDALISVGDEIKIRLRPGESPPTPTPTATPTQRYTIREGDTAWAVAARFGISLDELLAWNQLPQDPLLSVGQELWVIDPNVGQAVALPAADVEATPEPAAETPAPTSSQTEVVLLPTVTPTGPAIAIQPTGATPTQTATSAPATEVAAVLESVSENELEDEAVQVERVPDRPETVLNLPLILGIIALLFLGIGGWLFVKSRSLA